MGAREDFMAMRRAVLAMDQAVDVDEWRRHGDPLSPFQCSAALFRVATRNEVAFIRLAKAGVQNELIDLAWAVLGEKRPGGPAAMEGERGETA